MPLGWLRQMQEQAEASMLEARQHEQRVEEAMTKVRRRRAAAFVSLPAVVIIP